MTAKNILIRASAGTGKTFSLATRFILLMARYRVSPKEILALTFTRAAAQEIYTKLLERLWEAAKDDDGARDERAIVFGSPAPVSIGFADGTEGPLDAGGFSKLLRTVTDHQHLGNIATLDSFILRLVRNFPLELGFQNAVRLLDAFEEEREFASVAERLLSGAPDERLTAVFRNTRRAEWPRSVRAALAESVREWKGYALAHRGTAMLTEEGMAGALGLPEARSFDEEAPATSAAGFAAGTGDRDLDTVWGKIREFIARGDWPNAPDSPKPLVAFWQTLATSPGADAEFSYTVRNRTQTRRFPPERAAAIAADLERLKTLVLRRGLREAVGRLRLFGMLERLYDRRTRRAGMLTFNDLPQIRRSVAEDGRGDAVENLEYRFDSKFNHWALDEFQDTSEVQWICLRNLVQNAAESSEKSVVTVGDLKQSIYAWRGGDERPFLEMMSWPAVTGEAGEAAPGMAYGEVRDNDVSYRYQENICAFINSVFGEENMRGPVTSRLSERCREAVSRWLNGACWRVHVPDRYRSGPRIGEYKDEDYVKVIASDGTRFSSDQPDENEAEGMSRAMVAVLPALASELRRLWKAHRDGESTDSVGILVRKNEQGAALALYLLRRGIPAVWEGMSGVLDAPAVHLILGLLSLAEHPQDTAAWKSAACSPLVGMIPEFSGVADVEERTRGAYVSRIVASMLSAEGLARTVGRLAAPALDPSSRLDAYSRSRLTMLTRAAVAYEQMSGGVRETGAFIRYLGTRLDRELADSPCVVRVLSIHRSKGLTLDWVLVPLFDTDKASMDDPGTGVISAPDESWALAGVTEKIASLNPVLRDAYDRASSEAFLASLHTYYVALTRARKAMYVFLAPETKRLGMSAIIRAALPHGERAEGAAASDPSGTSPEVWYARGTEPVFGRKEIDEVRETDWSRMPCETEPERRSPSRMDVWHGGRRSPFVRDARRSVEHGTEVHAFFETVEWALGEDARAEIRAYLPDGVEPSPAFWAAFEKPEGFEDLWREKPYELLERPPGDGGRSVWVSGKIDRVVFSAGRAVVYDFKAGRRREGESDAEFACRLAREYASQMEMYRRAVTALTGCADVTSVLLSTETGMAVPVV